MSTAPSRDTAVPDIAPVPEIVVENLVIDFPVGGGLFRRDWMRAASDVSLTLRAGEAFAIVGESGSGKSTCARAISGIIAPTSGRILIEGQDVTTAAGRGSRRDHARKVQMIFQDPFGSLNPTKTIRHHIARPIRIHHPGLSADEVEARVIATLERVGLAPARQTADKFPYELSGGQRQRVAIARAVAVGAQFILADEPISMLDVSIRLGILNLMDDMKREGIGFMYITHDIATARYFAERTGVMYLGHLVEWGNSDRVTQGPQHPYTQLLLGAVPQTGERAPRVPTARRTDMPMRNPDSRGCPFAGRCPAVMDRCRDRMPGVTRLSGDHFVRCFLHEGS